MSKATAIILSAALLLNACSSIKKLPEGAYSLTSNKVEIKNCNTLSKNDIAPYIRQRPNAKLQIGSAPVVFQKELVESSMENIAAHLEYLGFYNSEVLSRTDTTKRRGISVTYTVVPGRRIRVDTIIFVLPDNNEFSDEFNAGKDRISIRKGDFLSERKLEEESARSASYFHDLGYYNISKNNYFFYADTLSGRTILEYRIREHTRNESAEELRPFRKYSIGEVTISHSGQIKLKEKLLRRINTLHPGNIYRESDVNDTYNRMTALKVFNGINIEASPTDSNTVNFDIKLTESKVQGIKIDVEASTNSSVLIGVSPSLNWYHKNIFRGGEWLSLGFTGNFQFKPGTNIHASEYGASASLSLPRFFGRNNIPRMEIKASYNYQNRPEYMRNLAGFSFGYTGQIRKNFFYQIYPLRANFVSLYNVSEEFARILDENPYMKSTYTDHLDAGMRGNIYLTSNSDIVPKTSYRYLRFSLDLSGNILGAFSRLMPENLYGERLILGSPFYQYARGELSLGQTLRFGKNDGQAIALRLTGGIGYAYGNSVSMPFEQQFYAGGANSMRAWQARMLGPGADPYNDSFAIPSQTGNMKMEFDVEYRFRMIWKLEGALFAEAGNVWDYNRQKSGFLKTAAVDWGAGVRLNLDFILIRLDAGFKLYDPSDKIWRGPGMWFKRDGYAIQFGIGYPF